MPVVTVTIRKPKSAEFKGKLLGAVHASLVEIGANPNDLFHRVLELDGQGCAVRPDVPGRPYSSHQ